LPPAPSFENQFHDSVQNVIQGERIELIVGAPRPGPVRWPHRIGTVPPLAASRQEREADERLSEEASPCQVLSGMGGVGKTQLAAAYATHRWDRSELDLLVWVNASSRESISAAFAQAGVELCGAEPGDDDQAAAAFLNLLSRPEAPRWLVVLDDLTDPADLRGFWPPAHPKGRTLVTTRRRDAALDGEGRARIDIGLFSPEESLAYLHKRLGARSRRIAGAAPLIERLGRLPLALAQVSAFILDQPGLTCEDYLSLLEDRTVALAEISPETAPDDYHSLLNAAWSLSIEQANRHEPEGLANRLLLIAALLDPAGIPASLFTAGPVLRHLGPGLRAHQISAALGRLHRLSLLDTDGTLVRMHALMQRVVVDTTTAVLKEPAAQAAADALSAIWPDPENDRAFSAVLQANAMRLFVSARSMFVETGIPPMLFKVGNSLGTHGQVAGAAKILLAFTLDFGLSLGGDHPDVLRAWHQSARWTGESGKVQRAIEMFESILADRTRVLGPDHPDTLSTGGVSRGIWTRPRRRPKRCSRIGSGCSEPIISMCS
jgi:hypothetical protein